MWLPGDSLDHPGGCRYEPEMVDRFVEFSREFLRFPTGHLHGRDVSGRPVEWSQWQLDRLVRPMFGVVTANGARATSTVFYLSARGTGKTTFAAAVGLFGLCSMGVANPEVDLFAVSKEQALRMFECAARFVRANEWLSETLTVHDSRKRISCWANGGELVVRSGDAEAELGLNPSMVLFDELLAQKNRALWDAVVTAMGKRAEDLLLVMTTPSTKVESFARQVYERAKRVEADRSLEPYFLPVIYESDPDDDPWAEATWKKACPALATGFMNLAKYRSEAAVAKIDAVERHKFLVFRLAQWAQAGGGFINLSSWDDNIRQMPKLDRLKGLPCFFGLDMAGTTDLASLALLWWDKASSEGWVQWRHWSTKAMGERLNQWTSGAWNVWAADPSVKLVEVPGSWIHSDEVVRQVEADYNRFRPLGIGIDSFRARDMNRQLGEEREMPVQLLNQSAKSMHAATERLRAMVHAGLLFHNGDKIARWAASSCEYKYDSEGFPKLIKSNLDAKVRIDPIAALSMAVDRLNAHERDITEPEVECEAYFIEV